MKIQKTFNLIATILSLSALLSLSLPLYNTTLLDQESCYMVVKLFNLVEFSPWGGFVLLAPIALLGLMLSKLNNNIKTIGLLILFILTGVALCSSTSAAYEWICNLSTGFVQTHPNHLIYAALSFLSMFCFYIANNMNWDDCESEV